MRRPKQDKSALLIAPGDHLVAIDRFIQATRDSGYKGTNSAIAELVDNALQAGATKILVNVEPDDGVDWLRVEVADNGSGMSPATLREALRFGGSSRFNDRQGLGRYAWCAARRAGGSLVLFERLTRPSPRRASQG
jgi:signal transduction histidine kinase